MSRVEAVAERCNGVDHRDALDLLGVLKVQRALNRGSADLPMLAVPGRRFKAEGACGNVGPGKPVDSFSALLPSVVKFTSAPLNIFWAPVPVPSQASLT